MSKSNHLFELIKSMTKSEKRFFKISTQKHDKEENLIYIKLFDAIDGQTMYDEKEIKSIFHKEPFISRLAMEKYNLYHLILNALNEFNRDISVLQGLYNSLRSARVLYDKYLFDHALKIIISAKEKAIKHNKQYILLELIDIQIACINSLMDFELLTRELPELHSEIEQAIKQISRSSSYINFYSRFIKEGKSYFSARTSEQKSALETIYSKFSNAKDIRPETTDDFFRYYSLMIFYFLSKGDNKESLKKSEILFSRIKEDREFVTIYPERYLNTLFNLMMLHDFNEQFRKSMECYMLALNYTEQYKIKESGLINSIILRFYVYRLNQAIRYGDFKQGLLLLEGMERKFVNYQQRLNNQSLLSFYYNAAYLYFINRNYKKAQKSLNGIINVSDSEIRVDIACYARIFNLVIYYEMDKLESLFYSLKNTYYFLNKNKMYFNVEKLIFNFFKKLINKTPAEKKDFITFRDRLDVVLIDSSEAQLLEYFDLPAWIESKINNEDFETALMRNRLNRQKS